MTGFAQTRGEVKSAAEGNAGGSETSSGKTAAGTNGRLAFSLSFKSVNHRFLDLHFRMPSGTDSLEMQLRRLLKQKIAGAQQAAILRLKQLQNSADNHHELIALTDALTALKILGETIWAE